MGGMILLTGGTGFLGSQVARLILKSSDHRLAVLVRGQDEADARRRLRRTWSAWPETAAALDGRVQVIRGDLSLPALGIDEGLYSGLVRGVTHIIHSAAELRLDGSLEDLRRSNVQGTAALLELAREAQADHGLQRFSHVSTAYVAGDRKGEVAEGELIEGQGFSNAYEQTKSEGEALVMQAMKEFPISVFRPGMVVGDSLTGDIQSFNTVYVPLRMYLTGRLKLIPARPDMPLNIVPVDYVAGAIATLTFDQRAAGLTFHLTVARELLPRTKELLDSARTWAAESLGLALPSPRFLPIQKLAGQKIAGRLGLPISLLPYFDEDRSYLRDNVDRLMGPYAPDWDAILPRLFDYAARRGFLRSSGQTVHEQLIRRLRSSRLPLRIHDIAQGGDFRRRSGPEMIREIRRSKAALRALGLRPGDRVALVGLNSSRFLALEAAIGLSGAVSVPLYYTSPMQEIKSILEASGARMLLVGAPGLLAPAAGLLSGERDRDPAIVSFCDSPLPPELAGKILPWDCFLGLGDSTETEPELADQDPLQAPAELSDLATIRYTSGTTGAPKGVTFRHDQLLWLAETLASLLPWKARTSPARYVSFLPMNHVVEGILGTYAPSCIPAPVDIFFLEDFHALAKILPAVRPTVFFSVPRFYEKAWASFEKSLAGRLYLSLPKRGLGAGWRRALRRGLRPFLRALFLRRAGLDRCDQLIVGSAPCQDSLLEGFRELGVEIHNAYGLTEAPLVTLNRLGANRLGSVGLPLPETELRLAPDDEVMVRGPQVSAGYFGVAREPILSDGWFCTGDLGEIGPNGELLIRGRKKEILITSYGKNIHPAKIEGLLRQIPGMAEAVVIGNDRPALSALLWLKGGIASPEALEEIDRSVRLVNGGLSHPEQVRRWAILEENPGIETGELTGNMKIRRQALLARRSEVVEMLYGAPGRRAPGVLHVGESQCA
jgi:long-chain acyl-CoA synthetase